MKRKITIIADDPSEQETADQLAAILNFKAQEIYQEAMNETLRSMKIEMDFRTEDHKQKDN